MSSTIISSADPTVHLRSNPNQSPKTQFPQNISFNSHLTKTRISTRKQSAGPPRACAAARIEASYAPAESKETLYELLGIAGSGSSFSDIKKAYKQMARKYHPDVSPPERVEEYTQRFVMVHEAYETLSNPQTRALYDRDLAFSSISPRKFHQGMEEKEEWQTRWQSQLDELQHCDCRERTSWGARMRCRNSV